MPDENQIWPSRYYTIVKIYLNLVGVWPYRRLLDKYIRFVLMFTCSLSIAIPQSLYVINNPLDLDDIFESVPSILVSIISSVKLMCMMMNNEKIKTCLETIKNDWLSLKTEKEETILQRQTMYGRNVTIFYVEVAQVALKKLFIYKYVLVLMSTSGFLYLLKSLIVTFLDKEIANTTKSTIPGISRLPFLVDYNESMNQHFYLIMIHCYLGVIAHVLCTIAVDILYYTLVQHACGMFAIIGCALENISKDIDADFDSAKDMQNDYSETLNCLRRHLHVIEFANLIESVFTNTLLVSVIINTICGSICGIRVIMNLNDAKDIAAPLGIYIAQLTHIFLQFWQAQFMLDYSVAPYTSACRTEWYKTSRKCQKLFLLIMSRSVFPCKLTAGKVMTLSIGNFGAVLKTSMSYFMVLRSFM